MLEERSPIRSVYILREEVLYFRLKIEIPFLGTFKFSHTDPDIRRYCVCHLNKKESLIMRFDSYEAAENWCSEMGYEVEDRW